MSQISKRKTILHIDQHQNSSSGTTSSKQNIEDTKFKMATFQKFSIVVTSCLVINAIFASAVAAADKQQQQQQQASNKKQILASSLTNSDLAASASHGQPVYHSTIDRRDDLSGRSQPMPTSRQYAAGSISTGNNNLAATNLAATTQRASAGPAEDLATAAGHHHGHAHGKYYEYREVPKKKTWKFGYKRGNHKHTISRHEHGKAGKKHSHFKTKVKWHDKKSKGKGIHLWDYNHHDKKHGHHG